MTIEMEDATRYLPHDPTGRCYEHYVYSGEMRHPITGATQRRIVFTGSKSECETFVARNG